MRHLRYFVAVAEEASFTAAAQRVHVTQQVLSTQIRQLEDAVGTLLLERTSRGVALTALAEAFSARPGIVFVPSRGVRFTSLCVAWRADDMRPEVLAFVKVASGGVADVARADSGAGEA